MFASLSERINDILVLCKCEQGETVCTTGKWQEFVTWSAMEKRGTAHEVLIPRIEDWDFMSYILTQYVLNILYNLPKSFGDVVQYTEVLFPIISGLWEKEETFFERTSDGVLEIIKVSRGK